MLLSLRRLGLIGDSDRPAFSPLTGGVSSDILCVTAEARRFCVKRALACLKVTAVWEAPVERNAFEAAWLRQVGAWLPDNVPKLLGEDASIGMFAMEFLPSHEYPVWKLQLQQGRIDDAFAASAGAVLAATHNHSAGNLSIAKRFANDAIFESIRLAPYFRATAERHANLADALHQLADSTLATRIALVHGDVSPKNILVGSKGPVFLDAECAWYGDPAFDLAFCLNHLLLKAVWRPQWKAAYLKSFDALSQAYLEGVLWEAPRDFERRCARLLPALALARIDGKSPVEYIVDEPMRELVRQRAIPLILDPVDSLAAIKTVWSGDS